MHRQVAALSGCAILNAVSEFSPEPRVARAASIVAHRLQRTIERRRRAVGIASSDHKYCAQTLLWVCAREAWVSERLDERLSVISGGAENLEESRLIRGWRLSV